MEFFRNTPVEKKQMVRTYERFSQVVSHILQPNGRVMVVGEWGGRSIKASSPSAFRLFTLAPLAMSESCNQTVVGERIHNFSL